MIRKVATGFRIRPCANANRRVVTRHRPPSQARRTINYKPEDFVAATGDRAADAILDMVGGARLARNDEAAAANALMETRAPIGKIVLTL